VVTLQRRFLAVGAGREIIDWHRLFTRAGEGEIVGLSRTTVAVEERKLTKRSANTWGLVELANASVF